nr:glycine--tRNA ligase, chloroplastic/mitochondrial 2 isoform X1 [Tanacetum cinerariifolium]
MSDTEQLKKMIIERSNYLAKAVDGCLVIKSCLLNEVMQKHQKYFALTDDKGNVLPYYIAVKEFLIYGEDGLLLEYLSVIPLDHYESFEKSNGRRWIFTARLPSPTQKNWAPPDGPQIRSLVLEYLPIASFRRKFFTRFLNR